MWARVHSDPTGYFMWVIIWVAFYAYCIRSLIKWISTEYSESRKFKLEIKNAERPVYISPSITSEPEVIDNTPLNEDDWDVIMRRAIEDAKKGNASARNFVLKNANNRPPVFNSSTGTVVPPPIIKPVPHTDQTIINDAQLALVSMGLKKREANNMVNSACSYRPFSSVQELIQNCLSNKTT